MEADTLHVLRSSVILGFVRGNHAIDIPDPLLNVWDFLSRLLHLFQAKVNEKSITPTGVL